MFRNVHLWLVSYLKQIARRHSGFATPTHVFLCIADHFEPLWRSASLETGLERVRFWVENYSRFAQQFRDADGRPPQHTFFFPAEQYHPALVEPLAKICAAGLGEVEVHLHHENDTADNLKKTLDVFKTQLRSHGLLPNDRTGRIRFGFVHGNWALDNSRRDGRCCGVNNELQVLSESGCYADFTLPSAPSDTQTRKINSLYYATDDPQQPKSHDTGTDMRVGGSPCGDLLIVQGPLGLNWRRRKWGLLPRIENAELSCHAPPTRHRLQLWLRQRIGVLGRPDWIFVKLHTHGCQERNYETLLGEPCQNMHRTLAREYEDEGKFVPHYVTARELFNLARAAESGASGTPESLRDFELPPPPCRSGSL